MADDIIFKMSVYDNKSDNKIYWDADMKIKSTEEGLKVLRMLQAAQTEIMDQIIKSVGVNIDNENIRRRNNGT